MVRFWPARAGEGRVVVENPAAAQAFGHRAVAVVVPVLDQAAAEFGAQVGEQGFCYRLGHVELDRNGVWHGLSLGFRVQLPQTHGCGAGRRMVSGRPERPGIGEAGSERAAG